MDVKEILNFNKVALSESAIHLPHLRSYVDEIKNEKYNEIWTCTSKSDFLISRLRYSLLLRVKVKWFLDVEMIKVMTC